MATNDIYYTENAKPKETNGCCPYDATEKKKSPIWMKNPAVEKDLYDTLHHQSIQEMKCDEFQCASSMMAGHSAPRPQGVERSREELLQHAGEFMSEYFKSLNKLDSDCHTARMKSITDEINTRGTYDLTAEELLFGAKLAWRNSARCVARMHWTSLELFDCRHVKTTGEMIEALIKHTKFATNGGNIRVGITVFPQHEAGREDFRLWNSQFIIYAGYEKENGEVMGDPQNINFTKVCQKLGWKGKGGRFDVLPLVVSAPNQPPEFYEIPEELILEVPIVHPELKCFEEMKLKWYALPAVADMRLDVGGIEFTAAPFNGWYTSPEIATRNFCDPHRFNLLNEIAERMGLDTSSNSTLWKDRAMVQMNVAVLHSYQSNGISIVDHHTAAEAYVKFMETEQRQRGGCPSDWVWIIPPLSAGIMPTYHQEMIMYRLRPSYEYQEKAWKNFLTEDEPKNVEN